MSRLDAEKLRHGLGDCTIGREIVVLDQTTSTNDAVLERATTETAEGLVIFAEYQTRGRGQRGNRWESAPAKGLWFSILLRPTIEVAESARLTKWIAGTIAETIRNEVNLSAKVKEPNDVLIDGRKVAGILVEMRAQPGAPHLAIAGIGINVNQKLNDFPAELQQTATSLAIALDRSVDRQAFATSLLRNLDRSYREKFGGTRR